MNIDAFLAEHNAPLEPSNNRVIIWRKGSEMWELEKKNERKMNPMEELSLLYPTRVQSV